MKLSQDGLRQLDQVLPTDLTYPYPWPASIAVPLTQPGTQIDGVGSTRYPISPAA